LTTQLQPEQSGVDPIWEEAIDIVTDLVRALYGSLGSQEFLISDIAYLPEKEIWRIKLNRRVEDLNLKYEIMINNLDGRATRFRKLG
jgi:hypothetical protein